MKTVDDKELESAKMVCFVANTPHYLYKHLRNDSTVLRIAREFSTTEIIEALSFFAGPGASEDIAPVAVDAYLVAISFKPLGEFREFIENLESPNIRWLQEMKRIILANQIITNTVNLRVPLRELAVITEPVKTQTLVRAVAPRIIVQ